MKIAFTFVSLLSFVAASTAFAQIIASSGTVSSTSTGFSGSASFGPPPPFAMSAVTDAPYSGEEVSERVQTLSDGTHITQTSRQRKIYRDAQGRTRAERPMMMGSPFGGAQVDSPSIVEITDPVAGFQYILDPQKKIAHRQALPAPPPRPIGNRQPGAMQQGVMGGVVMGQLTMSAPMQAPPPNSGGGGGGNIVRTNRVLSVPNDGVRPKFSSEQLGTQTIDGVLVTGTRTTTTYAVGTVGNDREFSVTSENWMSPELKIVVLTKSNDPRSGENTFRIENLSRTPPDLSLFMPPGDYVMVDEKAGFTVNFGSK